MIYVEIYRNGVFQSFSFVSRDDMNKHLNMLTACTKQFNYELFICEITTIELKPALLSYYSNYYMRYFVDEECMLNFYKGHVFLHSVYKVLASQCGLESNSFNVYPTTYSYKWKQC